MARLTLFDVSDLLDQRREHWVLALMLLVLHIALLNGLDDPASRALMTAHLGLFFLWQPIWQREQRLDWPALALILAFTAIFVGLLNHWFVFAWLIVLVGLVAGRSRAARQERYVYMLTLIFLIAELLFTIVPELFRVTTLNRVVTDAFRFGLFGVPLALCFLPFAGRGLRQTYPIEFFRGIIIALITALLALGSVLMSIQYQLDYSAALFSSLIAVAAFLVFISWLITPTAGTGFGALWEKSVLNIGTPFEAWISSLADLAARLGAPSEFLAAAMDELTTTPWIRGAQWTTALGSARSGVDTARSTEITTDHLAVTLFLEHALGPTLLLHCRLLIETLSHFYAAKCREQEQAHQAHVLAIHETGARLTHDIKNLLQSLELLTTAASAKPGRETAQLHLLQRQLPLIVQRLRVALDKLNRPREGASEMVPIAQWWQRLVARHGDSALVLRAEITDPAHEIPSDCFDSVVENLIDNARQKMIDGAVDVALVSNGESVRLAVTDPGAPVPAALVPLLFRQSVSSQNGFGIGLYQARQQAEQAGYQLALTENREGCVRFELSSR
jgi:signal transduction histidine kinase